MGTRFEPSADLDAVIAARFVRSNVDRITVAVRDAARGFAPDAKVWITMRDDRVRHTHAEADGQIIPDNLRYKVKKVNGSGFDLGRQPRDPAFPLPNRIECRCESVGVPGAVARSINSLPAVLQGTRVTGKVETRFPRAAESNNGTTEDQGTHFMSRGMAVVAATLRGARATRR